MVWEGFSDVFRAVDSFTAPQALPISSRWRLYVQHCEWSSVFYRFLDPTAPDRLLGASKFDQASQVAYPVTMNNDDDIGFKPFAGKFSS